MTVGFAEFLPVSILIDVVSEQLVKTALSAQHVRSEKSFRRLADYLRSIDVSLRSLNGREIESNLCVRRGLECLKEEVVKAESLINDFKERSRIYNLLHCRRTCEGIQKSIRGIGNSLRLLELYTVEINEDVRNDLMLIESDMVHAEVRASDDMLRVLETVQAETERGRSDRVLALEILERIAQSQGLVQSPSYVTSELNRFKREIEEAERDKERQDVQYMQQVMALLSQADAQLALETSRKRYTELRREVSRSRQSFIVHEPYAQFKCPLTGGVMNDPVVISSGRTYEREAILREFQKNEMKDPVTGQDLQDLAMMPNYALSCSIRDWSQQNYVIRILKAKIKLETFIEAEQEKAINELLELCKQSGNDTDWIVFESSVPLILGTLKQRNNELKARCFSLLKLLVKDSNHAKEKVAEAGGIKQIIKNLDRDPVVTREAIALLSELVKDKNILEHVGQECGAILTLVTILVRGSHPELRMDIENILDQLSYNENSYHVKNIQTMVMANWCKPFADCLHHGSEEFKLAMANALAHFELDSSRREALIQENVIDALVQMLKYGNFSSKYAALEALRNLSSHMKGKKHIAESGAVPGLLDLVKQPSLAMKGNIVAILVDLTSNDGASFLLYADGSPIEPSKIVQTIMGILTVSSLPTRTNAIKVLLRLAEPLDASEVRETIRDNDHHLQTFRSFVKTATPPLQNDAVQLLFLLCKRDVNAMSFVRDDEDCLKVLLHLIKNDYVDASVQSAAAGILSTIPASANLLKMLMITENVLPELVKMVSSQNLECQQNALGALIRFTDSSDIQSQRSLIELDLVLHLNPVLRSGTEAAKIWACIALANISSTTPRMTKEHHKWGFKLSWKSSQICKLHKGRCSMKDCIVEAEMVSDIVEILKDPNAEVALAGLKALETVLLRECMLEYGVNTLHKHKAIEQLIPLMQLDCHVCSEKCVELLEVVLNFPSMKDYYGQMVQKSLTVLFASRVLTLQQKALRLWRHLSEFIS